MAHWIDYGLGFVRVSRFIDLEGSASWGTVGKIDMYLARNGGEAVGKDLGSQNVAGREQCICMYSVMRPCTTRVDSG